MGDRERHLMGNNCVAGGGCPHKIDLVITNNTRYELRLDQSKECGRECAHRGFLVTEGKIVEGAEPPDTIKPFSSVTFSASGREGSAVAPKGKVFYSNEQENLNVMFAWSHSGWTSREAATADCSITGAKVRTLRSHTAWSDLLQVKKSPDSWLYTLEKKDGTVGQALEAVNKLADTG